VSLSQEPAVSTLKSYFVCGTHDISNESYAGASGRHDNFGNAIKTTNGAGPHNLQLFILAADGTVLTCLPGFWCPEDLVREMQFAASLNQVWINTSLSRSQKNQAFKTMHLAHIQEHPKAMSKRSHMQGFDAQYERQNRPNSDFLGRDAQEPKTVDVVMHQRMAAHPFENYERFDVAAYCDYGKPMYDKEEDFRDARGHVNQEAARQAAKIGNTESAKKNNSEQTYDPKLWGQGAQTSQNNKAKPWGQ